MSNMHLMLGLGFLAGGIRAQERAYNETLASIFGSLLTLSVAGLVLPTASQLLAKPVADGIVRQSRAIAIVFHLRLHRTAIHAVLHPLVLVCGH